MDTCDLPFNIDDWRSIPVIEERAATPDDVGKCLAVFATGEGQTEAVETTGLPALAELSKDDGSKESVVIVQIEKQVGGPLTVVGYVLPSGGRGVGEIQEFSILEYAGK